MLLSKRITTGAMCCTLVLIFAGVKYVFPAADFTTLTLSSLCIAIAVILTGIRGGVLTYTASSVLIIFFFGIIYALPFVLFFGTYPILKSIAEKYFRQRISETAKIFFLLIISFMIVIFFDVVVQFTGRNIYDLKEKSDIFRFVFENRYFVLIPILMVLFKVYDIILSVLIIFFTKRILPGLGRFRN